MGLDLHPARPSVTDEEKGYYGTWCWEPDWPHPQWSYDGFAHFRRRLASAEGFDLEAMKGFDGDRDWSEIITDLEPLLRHSDCDGELSPADCARVFPHLEEVIQAWQSDGDPGLAYDVGPGFNLVSAMKMCAADNLTLIFR
jgi:hypothetical protein